MFNLTADLALPETGMRIGRSSVILSGAMMSMPRIPRSCHSSSTINPQAGQSLGVWRMACLQAHVHKINQEVPNIFQVCSDYTWENGRSHVQFKASFAGVTCAQGLCQMHESTGPDADMSEVPELRLQAM